MISSEEESDFSDSNVESEFVIFRIGNIRVETGPGIGKGFISESGVVNKIEFEFVRETVSDTSRAVSGVRDLDVVDKDN